LSLRFVTPAACKDLTESLAIRPDKEAVIGEYMAKWIDS